MDTIIPEELPEELRARHEAFWNMTEVETPLVRVREFRPLSRGGNYGDITNRFSNNELIDPRKLSDDALMRAEPDVLIEEDLIAGQDLPGLCWTEGFVGCEVSMGEGGVWADPFLSWPGDITSFLASSSSRGNREWLHAFVRGVERLVDRAGGRYPITQTLLRGPIDMMVSAIGHSSAATAFLDRPDIAGSFLDCCADLFIEMAAAHLTAAPRFAGGYSLYGIWSPCEIVRTQLDNAVLFSPSMYRDFFLPRDRRVFERFDLTLMHVHSGCLHIAPILADEPDLNAIQISIDTPAGPTVEEMLPSLQLIQESTPIVITGPVTQEELDLLKGSLKPSGLCLDVFLK